VRGKGLRRLCLNLGRLIVQDLVSVDQSNELTVNDQRKLLVRIFGAKSLQFIAIGGPGKDWRKACER
jgi:hypothetical protein